jgi:hypothetical protein
MEMANDGAALRVWITYAWADNEEGNFEFLRQELADAGVEAAYDRVTLIPGVPIWKQIGERITEDPINGWAILVTPSSLASKPCMEELSYALQRALEEKGADFPLIGLVPKGVPFSELPPVLRVRLCLSLEDSNWPELLRAGLERRAPGKVPQRVSRYIWAAHDRYIAGEGRPPRVAVEVRPRFGQIEYWRFLVPKGTQIAHCGHARSGGARLSTMSHYIMEPNGANDGVFTHDDLKGVEFDWFGTGDPLSPTHSAYVVFESALPSFVGFAPATDLWGGPDATQLEINACPSDSPAERRSGRVFIRSPVSTHLHVTVGIPHSKERSASRTGKVSRYVHPLGVWFRTNEFLGSRGP